MDIQISFWGVILAAISAMVVGAIYYSPMVFGKQWSRATGVSEKAMAKARPMALPQLIIAALLTAYFLALFSFVLMQFSNDSFMAAALITAFWLWIGISATSLVAHEAFENRGKKLLVINVGNRLVTYMVMALILGWVGF